MNDTTLRRFVRWLPLLIALGATLAALALTALSALMAPPTGIPPAESPLGNLLSVAGTYLFRNALRNTALILVALSISVYLLARLAYRRRPRFADERSRFFILLYALAITPLFLPIPYAAYLWRPLFGQIDAVSQPDIGLAAVAFLQVWRLWPLAILLAPLTLAVGATRSAICAALTAALLALIDVGSPLIVTGGEPYNETHLWATWSFHTVWVSRHWSHGAVMYGGLAIACGIIGTLVWLTVPRARLGNGYTSVSPVAQSRNAILIAGAFSALLPLVWLLTTLVTHWGANAPTDLVRAGYWLWTATSLLALFITMLVAGAIALPALSAGAGKRTGIVAVCFIVGLSSAPVWDWIMLRWLPWNSPGSGLLVAALIWGIIVGMIALLPLGARGSAARHQVDSSVVMLVLFAIAALFTANQFALPVGVGERQATLTLGTGSTLQLAGSSAGTELALATAVTFALTFAGVAIAAFALTRLNRVASPPQH